MRSAALSLLLLTAALGAALPGQPPDPPWHGDYGKALAEAQRTGKPIFATFA